MSRLDELIAEFCPDGVTFKPIKEVYQRLKGTPITAGKMKEIDRNRASHRAMLASSHWGSKENYHLCINTSGKEIKALIPD